MKKKSFKIISLSLALLLLTAVIAPLSASAASCRHENRVLISEKVLTYTFFDEDYHEVAANRLYSCLDCGQEIYDKLSTNKEAHDIVIVKLLSHQHVGLHTHFFTERVRCNICGEVFVRTRPEICPGPPCLIEG